MGTSFLLAVCDENVLGKRVTEGDLEIEVRESFYKDEKCDSRKIVQLSREATIINAVGKNVVNILIDEGLVDSEKVLKIRGLPMAQMVRL
ncbi:MAG: DUF424 family protein [Candidatus Aenigmarchaeota archaeon]|nr:DUF424 family protein [Candidatus Aenigmarchaeota archaeon]